LRERSRNGRANHLTFKEHKKGILKKKTIGFGHLQRIWGARDFVKKVIVVEDVLPHIQMGGAFEGGISLLKTKIAELRRLQSIWGGVSTKKGGNFQYVGV